MTSVYIMNAKQLKEIIRAHGGECLDMSKVNRERFRQYMPSEKEFHYWGSTKEGVFVAPISNSDIAKPSEQVTGLVDKNGKDIWEYDIVQWKVGSIKCVGQVTYGTGEWNKGWPGHNMQALRTYMSSTEVIGNIHENPELIPKPR